MTPRFGGVQATGVTGVLELGVVRMPDDWVAAKKAPIELEIVRITCLRLIGCWLKRKLQRVFQMCQQVKAI